jgi:hypothetical protein
MLKNILCVASFFLLSSSLFAAQDPLIYKYSVKVPATANSCNTEAALLGARFVKATGMSLVSASCLGTVTLNADNTNHSLYWLYITYTGENATSNFTKLEYSAVLGTPSYLAPNETEGAYNSYTSCLQDIETQTVEYEKNTGLQHVAAFCKPALIDSASKYVLEVDGFGSPQSALYLFKPEIMQEVDNSIFVPELTKRIRAGGGVVVKVVGGAVLYYAKNTVQVNIYYVSFQDTVAHCQAQLQMAQEMFSQLPNSIDVRCVGLPDSGAYLTVLSGAQLVNEYQTQDTFTYATFDNCLLGRNIQISAYKTMGTDVLGALCEKSPDLTGCYQMRLFK